jgi:Tol biopolymer transport system component
MHRNIWLMPHSGGRAVPVVQRPGLNANPIWGPDGTTIYFVSSGGRPIGDPNFASTVGIWKIRVDPKSGTPRGESQEAFAKKSLKIMYPKFVAGGR